jgi:hypothetical protein
MRRLKLDGPVDWTAVSLYVSQWRNWTRPFAPAANPEDLAARCDALGRRYGLEFVPEWIQELRTRYNLKVLGEP